VHARVAKPFLIAPLSGNCPSANQVMVAMRIRRNCFGWGVGAVSLRSVAGLRALR
jgi:hypothetical protein